MAILGNNNVETTPQAIYETGYALALNVTGNGAELASSETIVATSITTLIDNSLAFVATSHDGGDGLALAQRQQVDHRLATRLRAGQRQFVYLELVDHAA